ncbi:MAG TPA: VWA domain-containing protein [Solirubrobacteraceae bacterium]|nr:VWA domain-containing protein [Solirubrobacteraceae bacterium]
MPAGTEPSAFTVETLELDLPAVAGAFSRRLHEAGLPTAADKTAAFTQALALARPITRRRLYWTARAVFVSDPGQARAFDAVFRSVFGGRRGHDDTEPRSDEVETVPAPADDRPTRDRSSSGPGREPSGSPSASTGDDADADAGSAEVPVALAPSEEEVLREKRFDELSPRELAQLYRLMTRLEVATPLRRTRRAERYRHGERIDLRRTLRGSLRTGGDPIALRRRRRRVVPRRLVLLCDISGSMEPYARAYLQFLTSAARSGSGVEAFAFATRLTRLTRALGSRNPERAIRNAAAAAPDWSSGTRIGDALKAFNDRHGRRGLARGAVIVIISDGWERGDPSIVSREMERLRRLAYRIVWVNPRAAAEEFAPRAGGMAAALPYLDALVSGHSLDAMSEVVDAIAGHGPRPMDPAREPEQDAEPWPSATPIGGSSVAMPSGYGPSRGRTTPGWDP